MSGRSGTFSFVALGVLAPCLAIPTTDLSYGSNSFPRSAQTRRPQYLPLSPQSVSEFHVLLICAHARPVYRMHAVSIRFWGLSVRPTGVHVHALAP